MKIKTAELTGEQLALAVAELRAVAQAAKKFHFNRRRVDDFERAASPDVVLALLDDLRRSEELVEQLTETTLWQAGEIARLLDENKRLRSVLWFCAEHNELIFGDKHNTVMKAREALKETT